MSTHPITAPAAPGNPTSPTGAGTIGGDRLGRLALVVPLAAIVYGVGLALRGPLVNPAALVDPASQAEWADWIARATFRPGYLLLTVSLVLQLVGFWAVYLTLPTRLARLGLAALLTSFVGVAMNITIHGVALLTPQAYPMVTDALQGPHPDPSVLVGAGLVQLSVVGAALFAVALWRTPGLPRWVAVAYLLHRLAFDFGGAVNFAVETSGVMLLTVAGVAVANRAGTTRTD